MHKKLQFGKHWELGFIIAVIGREQMPLNGAAVRDKQRLHFPAELAKCMQIHIGQCRQIAGNEQVQRSFFDILNVSPTNEPKSLFEANGRSQCNAIR